MQQDLHHMKLPAETFFCPKTQFRVEKSVNLHIGQFFLCNKWKSRLKCMLCSELCSYEQWSSSNLYIEKVITFQLEHEYYHVSIIHVSGITEFMHKKSVKLRTFIFLNAFFTKRKPFRCLIWMWNSRDGRIKARCWVQKEVIGKGRMGARERNVFKKTKWKWYQEVKWWVKWRGWERGRGY